MFHFLSVVRGAILFSGLPPIGTAAFFISILAGFPASSEDLREWGSSGKWTILIDPAAGNGCLMQTVLDDGARIRFGLVPERKGGFISVTDTNWPDFQAGTTGTMKLIFEDSRFGGEADFLAKGDQSTGYAFFDNPSFALDLARKREMTLVFSDGYERSLDLTGSARAADDVSHCQEEQP